MPAKKRTIEKIRRFIVFSGNHEIYSFWAGYVIIHTTSVNTSSYPSLKICLFGAAKLTKHVDVDLYKYSGYGIGFDREWFYSIGDEVGRNVIIFGADMSSSPHINN